MRIPTHPSRTVVAPILLALGAAASVGAQPSAGARETVLVLDFADRTGRLEPAAGARAADVLTARLLDSGRYVVVDPSRARQVVQEQDPGSFDITYPSSATSVGRTVGADKVVVGTFSSLTKRRNQFRPSTMDLVVDNEQTRLRVQGKVIDVASGTIVYLEEKEASHAETTGAATTVIDTGLVDELVEEALGQLAADLTSANLAAVAGGEEAVSVMIKSTPSGADVIVDDLLVGTTPLRVRLPERPHNLKLRLSGHAPYTRTVDVRAGLELSVPLDELPDAQVIREERVIHRDDDIDIRIR